MDEHPETPSLVPPPDTARGLLVTSDDKAIEMQDIKLDNKSIASEIVNEAVPDEEN